MIVDGQITNPNGNTTIDSSGSITVTPNGSISSENLTLSAAGGIGTSIAAVPITIDGGFLDATDGSTNGIYLKLASGASISAITAGDGPTYGNVVIDAAGSLLPENSSSTITGDNITLDTTVGSIGSAAGALRIDALPDYTSGDEPIGGVVNASAPGEIVLTQTSGNLLVGEIASSGADVTLAAPNGSILDASGQTAAQTLDSTRSRRSGTASASRTGSAASTEFDNEVVSYYNQYWDLLRDGTVVGSTYDLSPSSVAAYTQQTATALDLADPTTTDVSDYAAYLYTETVDFFNDVAAPGYTPPDGRSLSGPGAPLPGYDAPLLARAGRRAPTSRHSIRVSASRSPPRRAPR